MRILLTGASGFIGSNLVRVFEERHGDTVITDRVDMTDGAAVAAHVAASKPDGIVHNAILNDWDAMYADRHRAWASYVDATRHYVTAAEAADVPFVLVSTDWVYDGTQHRATEDTPTNPINLYGFLKAASEIVTREHGGSVARVSGVQGVHWSRPATPRVQDPGYGYLVLSLVDALEAGRPFTVWDQPGINRLATPSLATRCGEVIRRVLDHPEAGIFHCSGSDAVSRVDLAELTVEIFGLDRSLLQFGPVPPGTLDHMVIPEDTSLDATSTAERLGYELGDIHTLLTELRHQHTTGELV